MIAIQAVLKSVKSLVDGGWVVSFDAHEGMLEQVMSTARLKGERLYLVVMTEDQYEAKNA